MLQIERLVRELIKLPKETEWVEFKENSCSDEEIGEYISALGNSATLYGKRRGYLIFGVTDDNHSIVGTTYDFNSAKVGNEDLGPWLRRLLSENANFEVHQLVIEDKNIVVIEIYNAVHNVIKFKNIEYIRVNSYKKKLKDYPSLERKLWDKLLNTSYEMNFCLVDIEPQIALQYIDYPNYFFKLNLPLPTNSKEIIQFLIKDNVLEKQDNGLFSITNLGAILFARNLNNIPSLKRKTVRIIEYVGNNRIETQKELEIEQGYALGFELIIQKLQDILPRKELISNGIRRDISIYPDIALREIVANALIHQDFSITGTGPTIEIFEDRCEITNPGPSLIDITRIIDSPPKSRNENLAAFMRRIGVCEERGSGWDKIVSYCELYQLPAPKIDIYEENTKVTIFARQKYSSISKIDRLRACYFHACLKYVSNDQLTNTSLRERFGIEPQNNAMISRLIKEACACDLIKPFDKNSSPKNMRYVPFWA